MVSFAPWTQEPGGEDAEETPLAETTAEAGAEAEVGAAAEVAVGGGGENDEQLRRIFDKLDEDASGELDRDEVRSLVTQLGMDASEKDVDKAMATMDADGGGTVDFEEFCAWWRSRPCATDNMADRMKERLQSLQGADPVLEQHVLYAFELIDADNSGRLDREEVQAAAKRLGANMEAAEAARMFDEMEKGPSGEVGFHAFRRWYLQALEDGRVPKPDMGGPPVETEASSGRQLWGHAKTRLNALLMFKTVADEETLSTIEFENMTPDQWAEWVANAKWWERMNAGHAPRPRPQTEPVNAASFRLERPLPPGGKKTRGIGVGRHAARVLESRKYENGVSNDWPSVGTQLPGRPCGYIPKPEPPPSPLSKPGQTASSAFRRQMLRRRVAATGSARLGTGRDGARLAMHSRRSARLVAPEDVPRVNHIRAQRAHHELGTVVAEAAWEKAGRRGVAQVLAEVIDIAENRPTASPIGLSPPGSPENQYLLNYEPDLGERSTRPSSGGSTHSNSKQLDPTGTATAANLRRKDIGKLGAAMLTVDHGETNVPGHTGRWQPLTWSVRPPASDFFMVPPHTTEFDKSRVVMSTENGKRLNVTWRERYPYRQLDSHSAFLGASTDGTVAPQASQLSQVSTTSTRSGGSTFRRERALTYNHTHSTQHRPSQGITETAIYEDMKKGFSESNDSLQSFRESQAKSELPFVNN
eukprot:COSAG02_NODE_76_length_41115_cov_60.967817_31_plen_700_part_00